LRWDRKLERETLGAHTGLNRRVETGTAEENSTESFAVAASAADEPAADDSKDSDSAPGQVDETTDSRSEEQSTTDEEK
jgi:hypothetical protein